MRGLALLRLAFASLLSRRTSALLTILAIAVSVFLFVGVEKLRLGVRAGFEQTVSGTDLIVGARTSPVSLLLSSVFRIGDATANIRWESYERIAAGRDVAWTVPLSLGDSHRGFRVVGTTPGFFEHYGYAGGRRLAFASGRAFGADDEAVIGAAVAARLGYAVGAEIVLAHGVGAVSFSLHEDAPFRIVGILAPTGTPVDRAVHVDLAGIERMHAPAAARTDPEEHDAHAHAEPDQITAFLVGVESPLALLRLQREINTWAGEPLLAIIPHVALAQLWQVVGIVEQALRVLSVFVIVVGLVGVMTSILTAINARRREMMILRAVGARPVDLLLLVVSEAAVLAAFGSVLGVLAFHGGLGVLAPLIETRFGLALVGIGVDGFDLLAIAGVTMAAAVLGLVPAGLAFRNALADGLAAQQ